MAGTILVRIETLERRLEECLSRLDLEGKRRNILEDWIRLNFNFDVKLELENESNKSKRKNDPPKRPVKSSSSCNNQPGQNSASAIASSGQYHSVAGGDSSEANFIEMEVSPADIMYNSDTRDSSMANSSSRKRNRSGKPKNPGRPKNSIWNYFRCEPNPVNPKRDKVFCKKCGLRVSPEAPRLNVHIKLKCKGNGNGEVMDMPDIDPLDLDQPPSSSELIQDGRHKTEQPDCSVLTATEPNPTTTSPSTCNFNSGDKNLPSASELNWTNTIDQSCNLVQNSSYSSHAFPHGHSHS